MRFALCFLFVVLFAATTIARKPRRFLCPPVATAPTAPAAVRSEPLPKLPPVVSQPAEAEVSIGKAAKAVAYFLETQSLAKWLIDDARAKELLQAFIAHLDPHQLYFLQSDWQEFAQQETALDDQLKAGDLSFVKLVYQRFNSRAAAAQPLIRDALRQKHDFTLAEVWPFPYADFAADKAALAERWRLRIKGEILFERGNDAPLADAVAFLQQRYENSALHQRALTEEYLQTKFLDLLCRNCDRQQAYLGEEELLHYNGKQLRGPKYSLNLRLWPLQQGRPRIWSVVFHQVDPAELVGWDVVAIRTIGGKTHHLVGVCNYELWPLQRALHATSNAPEVILELQHPTTLQRKSLAWPQTELKNPYAFAPYPSTLKAVAW